MTTLKPTYISQVQKPYLCAMACLNMIVFRNFGILYEQEEIGHFFNVKIHPQYVPCFNSSFETTENVNDDEGLKTIEEENKINEFFSQYKINLTAKAYYLSDIHNLELFIKKHIQEGNDMWVEYKIEGIWQGYQGMHDGLIESMEGDRVTMINPGAHSPSRFIITLDTLTQALSNEFARETGIILIKK